ncbi:skin secretory protein xP2-like [Corvus moneduloides]|uniref:skin secretory protein xP2-like n=1 Tax=Corvus moneduloides TaxID=1196302 RepID=UPI001362BD24|nr:skin secretory protein xP2-like [Corvus moneduloides]
MAISVESRSPVCTARFRAGAAGAARCPARTALPRQTQPPAEIVPGHPAGKSHTASTPDPGDGPGEPASPPGKSPGRAPLRTPLSVSRCLYPAHRAPLHSTPSSIPRTAPAPSAQHSAANCADPAQHPAHSAPHGAQHRARHPAHIAQRTPHRTPHSAPHRTPLSAPPPLSACLRRTPPGANSRPRTGFPRGSSVLSRLIACSVPFPARGRVTAARPAPPSGGARGASLGWASRLSPSNSATIAHHRCASPLKGAPYCSPLYLAERFIIFLLFPGSSVPQLACAVEGFRHSLVAALLAASLLPASGRRKPPVISSSPCINWSALMRFCSPLEANLSLF